MKRCCLFLILLALAFPHWPALAQDPLDTTDWQAYSSEDGFLIVSYPPEWVSEPQTDFPGVLFGSSQEALDSLKENESAERGGMAVGVILFPSDFIALLGTLQGVEISPDLTQADLTIALAESLIVRSESPEESPPITGDPIEIELEDQSILMIVPFIHEELSLAGFIVAYPVGEGVTLIGIGNAHGEDYDDELQQMLLDIILSAEYTGTAEDLLASMGM